MNSNSAKLVVLPTPSRFSDSEWGVTNKTRTRFVEEQQQLADRIIASSNLLLDHSHFQLQYNKDDTNYVLKEKIKNYEFKIDETNKVRRKLFEEIETLELAYGRIANAMSYIRNEGLLVCTKCIVIRESRVGIDLVFDLVEQELLKELEIINGALKLLERLLEQCKEQTRIMRAAIYLIDQDLGNKEEGKKIDLYNLSLHEKCLNLSVYHGSSPLANSNISENQWNESTAEHYSRGSKTLNNSIQLRIYIDKILSQTIEDLIDQFNIVNETFRRRIEEAKESKTKLELHHYETTRQINEITRNITRLEKALAEKEGYVALAHTRLGNRAQRPNMELCRDTVEVKLMYELEGFADNVNALQQMLSESHATLRYLKKIQLQIEEDINVKTNSLKIDEVDCMTLRQTIDYHSY